ncbi:MAG: hypothetical protein PVH61_39545 [Candidatus Aminicenantes bacterium]
MKLKSLFILLMMMFMALSVNAAQSVTFLKDGNKVTDVIIDMSSRTGQIEYRSNYKVHRNQVWMINYVDANWDFPNERSQLSNNTDTVFLRDGTVIQDKIVDFSSRRWMWEFMKTRAIPESQIKRIYFCCTQLPGAYQQTPQQPAQAGDRYSVTFLVTGKSIEVPLSYLNSQKTGFTDGLQINTHDIWMINFEDNQWDFPAERGRLNKRQDTIFLKDGNVIYDNINSFSEQQKTFRLGRNNPIHESQIKRIYFCCTVLPNDYKGVIKFRRRR